MGGALSAWAGVCVQGGHASRGDRHFPDMPSVRGERVNAQERRLVPSGQASVMVSTMRLTQGGSSWWKRWMRLRRER